MSQALQTLYAATVHAFTHRPETERLYLFGSMEQGTHDAYSDLDMHVVSSDFDATMQDLPDSIRSIGEPFLWYPFHLQPGNTSYAILFRDYPLYNRLDLTILDTLTPPTVAQGTCVYQNPQKRPSQPSTYQSAHLDPQVQTISGYGIGALRYTKYRKRGKPLSAAKFYRAQCDYYFLKHYEQTTQKRKTQIDLSVYQFLDQLPEKSWLHHFLYPANEHAMDQLYMELIESMLSDEQETLSTDHLEALSHILTFVRQELLLP